MRRRALLSALPAVGSSIALAGCMDRAGSILGDTPDDEGTDDGSTPAGRSTPVDGEPEITTLDGWKPEMLWLFGRIGSDSVTRGEGVEVVGVGSGEVSHWVTVAAAAEDAIETTVTVQPVDGEPLYESTVALSNERYVAIRFAHVGRYTVRVETVDHQWETTVSDDSIDCNESGQVALLAEDGDVRSIAATTDMACE